MLKLSAPAVLTVLALLGAGVLPAQSPPDDARRLAIFSDSVRHVADPIALVDGLEHWRDDRTGTIASRETRKGWIAFRLAELESGRERLDEAIRYFDEAILRDKSMASAWVGLAEVKLLLESRGAVVKASMNQSSGEYYEVAALRHLASALRAQPRFPVAVALLGRLLLDFDSPDYPDDLVRSIRLAAEHPDNGPIPQLLLGRYLRKQRDFPGARTAFDRFAELGGNPGLADLEISRVVFAAGRSDSAVALYLAGVLMVDSVGRVALRRDIAWIASPAELKAFDRQSADSIGPWIRRLWAERDAASVRPEGDRLKEHIRRWWYVQEHFQLTGRRRGARFGWGTGGTKHEVTEETAELGPWALFEPGTLPESDPRSLGIDDRGKIYMRHGEPDARASAIGSTAINGSSGGCGIANESWKYELPTGPIILHFCANEALGAVGPTTLVSMIPLDPAIIGARGLLDVRFGLLELSLLQYLQAVEMSRRGINTTRPRINQETVSRLRQSGQASVKLGLTTDTYPLDYAHDLDPTIQIFGLSRAPNQGRALVVFAIRGDRLTPEIRQGRLVYPLKMRVTAVDTTHGITRTVDTLRLFVSADTIRGDRSLYGTLDLPLPSGTYFVRVLVEQPGRNAAGAVGRPDVVVPGEPGNLTLSDLVTGRSESGLVWEHKGRKVPLNPLDMFPEGSSVELYYELGESIPQHSYRTTMNFTRIQGRGGKGKDEATLSFTERSEGNDLVVQRTIGLNELGVGRYLLVVTITEEGSERSVTAERMINVVRRR